MWQEEIFNLKNQQEGLKLVSLVMLRLRVCGQPGTPWAMLMGVKVEHSCYAHRIDFLLEDRKEVAGGEKKYMSQTLFFFQGTQASG